MTSFYAISPLSARPTIILALKSYFYFVENEARSYITASG